MQEEKIKPLVRAKTNFQLKGNAEALSAESLAWFRKYVTKNLHRVDPRMALRSGKSTLKPMPGFLYVYSYDPKYKDTLPYYDTYPLILCLDVYKDGWLGINVHYMPPKIRELIFTELLGTLSNDRLDEKTKIKTNWAKLKVMANNRYIAHACKRYLTNHLVTPLCKIDPEFWEVLIFMPIARFEKASIREVWKDIK